MAGRACALVGALSLVAVLAGCAAPQTRVLLADLPQGTRRQVELSAVPFFPQEIHQCGPAALATVLGASGVDVTPEALVPQVYLPGREGSLQVEMLAAARRHGRVAVQLSSRLNDLLSEVAAGNPVLVLQNLGLSWYPRWHYAVAVGYDLKAGEVVLRSGRTAREVLPLDTFEHTWTRGGGWAMLTLAPDRLPASVPEKDYVAAVVALEQSGGVAAARVAYRSALNRWPASLPALIGAGNTAYAEHDLAAAEQAFRRAVAAHPKSDAALNNLAQVLADRGRRTEAMATARRAVALAGPNRAAAEQTLREISNSAEGRPGKAGRRQSKPR